jgi:hypothetical protein
VSRVRPAAALVGVALVLGGCAVSGPAPTRTSTAPGRVARADRTHEVPTPALRQTAIGGWRNPAQAVAVFTGAYINWTATTLSTRLSALAEVCVGQARSAMLLGAAEAGRDYELHGSGVANRGSVEAVASLPAAPRQYVVVTRETTVAPGRSLAPVWHVTLATVTRIAGGLWVLSRWQPES